MYKLPFYLVSRHTERCSRSGGDFCTNCPAHSSTPAHRGSCVAAFFMALVLPSLGLMGVSLNAQAQGSQLRPPSQLQSPTQQPPTTQLQGSSLQPPTLRAPAIQASALQAPALQAPTPQLPPSRPLVQTNQAPATTALANKPQLASVANLSRFRTLKIDGKPVDIAALPDSTVLRGKSGKTITVAQLKQLEARINSASTAPMLVAKPGQSIKSLAAAPAGTRIALPGGRVARTEDLVRVQSIYAKLSEKRVVRPVPQSMPNATAVAVVGQGTSLADALKRPAGDVIQIGSRKYTAEHLRQIDAMLKASPRDPRGLLERARGNNPSGQAPSTSNLAIGPRIQLQRGASIQDMLTKPDSAVLQSPSGKLISVAQLKQYMAYERLTPAQLQARMAQGAGNRVVEIK